jgi:tRNA threonylcarbamoyladenosine biosynthesis protein TsaB
VRDGDILAERTERTPSSTAGTLPRLVEEVIADAGERPARGDAVAVSIGPGSFTGLRIGLSFAKGLAFAAGLRIVGVPTLDALALSAPPWTGLLCAALDARKAEIYAGLYTREQDRVVRLGAPIAANAARLAATLPTPCTFIGDAVEAYGSVFRDAFRGEATLLASAAHPPRASAVARLAAARLVRDPAGDDLAALVPVYVRPPEAELTQSVRAPSAAALGAAGFVDKVPLVY